MVRHVANHPAVPIDRSIKNNNGLTALTLACKLGRHGIFNAMLELDSVVSMDIMVLYTLREVGKIRTHVHKAILAL